MTRIGFVTCVELGLACLEEIERLGGQLDLLVTLDDTVALRKSGRIFVDDYARRNGIPVVKTRNINDPGCIESLRSAGLDYLLVIGWSQILHAEILSTVKHGIYGMHPTLLPIGRGRAPIPWTILKGLAETGVTAFEIAQGVDNGAIAGQVKFTVAPDETATSLYAKSIDAHRQLTRDLWSNLRAGTINLVAQDESKATHWEGRTPQDGEIKQFMTIDEVDRLVRATTRPYPGAFVLAKKSKVVIWSGSPRARSDEKGYTVVCLDGEYIATDYDVVSDDDR